MDPIRAFVICPHSDTLEKAIEFLREKDFEAHGVTDAQTSLSAFAEKPYDMVILSGGIAGKTREMLRIEFSKVNKDFEFIEHTGKPEDLLAELMEAFED